MRGFPNYIQTGRKDCGPTCLKIISKFYGKDLDIRNLRELSGTTRRGSNFLHLSEAAESIGYRTMGGRISPEQLYEATLPCIVHWNENHYVVLYEIKKKRRGCEYRISDPAKGLVRYNEEQFHHHFLNTNTNTRQGVALFLEPSPKFYEIESDIPKELGFRFLARYVKPYRQFIIQVIIGLFATSMLQLITPFLTQSIVDVGIQTQSINFIYLILTAQLFVFFGRTSLEFLRNWMLLNLSTRINISMLSDFFIKLMNLRVSYFDLRITGDIMQKISDYNRVQRIMTNSSLTVLFSMLNIVIIGSVLLIFNTKIFAIYLIGSLLFFAWIVMFQKKRKHIDNERFKVLKEDKNKIIELTNGMQDIKLHNAEQQKRWGWESIQV